MVVRYWMERTESRQSDLFNGSALYGLRFQHPMRTLLHISSFYFFDFSVSLRLNLANFWPFLLSPRAIQVSIWGYPLPLCTETISESALFSYNAHGSFRDLN